MPSARERKYANLVCDRVKGEERDDGVGGSWMGDSYALESKNCLHFFTGLKDKPQS